VRIRQLGHKLITYLRNVVFLNRYLYRSYLDHQQISEISQKLHNLNLEYMNLSNELLILEDTLTSKQLPVIELDSSFKEKLLKFKSLLKPSRFPLGKTKHLGNTLDGGYLIPYDIKIADSYFFVSIGIGGDISFDLSASDLGSVIMVDKQMTFDRNLISNNMILIEKNLNHFSDDDNISLKDLVKEHIGTNIVNDFKVLKMDIEGEEWSILSGLDIEILNTFDFLIFEIHDLRNLIHDNIYSQRYLVLSTLLHNFEIIYFSGNNYAPALLCDNEFLPDVCEIGLLRKSHYSQYSLDFGFGESLINQFKTNNLRRPNFPKSFY
jgi:hypothetical protein